MATIGIAAMRHCRFAFVLASLAMLCCAALPAFAHPSGWNGMAPPRDGVLLVQAPLDVQKDCQTVRTCDFRRSSAVRGCLSSFACRSCRFVAAPCRSENGRRVCQEMRCGWGAS